MPDYQKAKIYKISSPSNNLVYYGSTTQSLSQRLAGHNADYKKDKTNSSKFILECEDYKIELIENYPCNNREQLMKKEGEYIKNNDCVNKVISGRTDKEYYEDNKDKINERNKQYKINNKDKLKEVNKKYYIDNINKINQYRTKNKQAIAERQKEHRATMKEAIAEYNKQYRLKNKEVLALKKKNKSK